MGGRAILILVLGVSYILIAYQTRTGNISTQAVDNYVEYYTRTVSHEIAVSGLNIAAAKLYEDYSWRGPMSSVPFSDGAFSISFSSSGDTLVVVSAAEYEGIQDSVTAYFTGSSIFTKYTFYTDNENGVAWTPGDSIFGPIHTNGRLNHQNNSTIVFSGKVTAGLGISPPPRNSKTQFLGGYEVGVYNPQVTDINQIINSASSDGYNFVSSGDLLKIKFHNNGTVDVYRNSSKLFDDVLFSDFAPNGVIYTDGDLEIFGEGLVNTPAGGVTIGAGGDITLRDDINYLDNPLTNPASDDLLALVAWNDIIFDNSTKADWNIQCVLMAVNGSLTATDMNKSGSFNYLGSVYQSTRGNAKMFKSFQKKYYHDERLNSTQPPAYPGMSNLQLIAWWE